MMFSCQIETNLSRWNVNTALRNFSDWASAKEDTVQKRVATELIDKNAVRPPKSKELLHEGVIDAESFSFGRAASRSENFAPNLVAERQIIGNRMRDRSKLNGAKNGDKIILKNIALPRIVGLPTTKNAILALAEIGGSRRNTALLWKCMKLSAQNAIIGAMCVVRNVLSRLTMIIKRWLSGAIYATIVTGCLVIPLTLQNFFAKPQIIWSAHAR